MDASSGSSSYRVSISDQLLKTLQFRGMDSYRLAWLNAAINPPAEEVIPSPWPPHFPHIAPRSRYLSPFQISSRVVALCVLSCLRSCSRGYLYACSGWISRSCAQIEVLMLSLCKCVSIMTFVVEADWP